MAGEGPKEGGGTVPAVAMMRLPFLSNSQAQGSPSSEVQQGEDEVIQPLLPVVAHVQVVALVHRVDVALDVQCHRF